MGPVTILDKSAFQGLSDKEHFYFRSHFYQNITPVLILEIAADLSKEFRDGKTPEQKVTAFAKKFGGSGPPTNENYRQLCIASLLGANVPMSGQIISTHGTPLHLPDGSAGVFIDSSAFNHLILKLADGRFEQADHEFATRWRSAAKNLSLDGLNKYLNKHHVIIPRAASLSDVPKITDDLLALDDLQDAWLRWLLNALAVSEPETVKITRRWSFEGERLSRFAPYAYFCLRTLFNLLVVWRSSLLKWQPTNLIDVHYLYYLPFSQVFVSDDKVHRALAPLLLRQEDQSFVLFREFKESLRQIHSFMEGLSPEQQRFVQFALASRPPPIKDCVVHTLWQKHMVPWHPGMGNRAINLPPEEERCAIEFVQELFRKAGL